MHGEAVADDFSITFSASRHTVSGVYYLPSLLLGLTAHLAAISACTVIVGDINTYFRHAETKTKPSCVARVTLSNEIYALTMGVWEAMPRQTGDAKPLMRLLPDKDVKDRITGGEYAC